MLGMFRRMTDELIQAGEHCTRDSMLRDSGLAADAVEFREVSDEELAGLAIALEYEIKARLRQIDAAGERAARAVALAMAQGGAPDADDVARLVSLEAEAVALRKLL